MVESFNNDKKEIDYNQINRENLKSSINKILKQTQTKLRNHLIKNNMQQKYLVVKEGKCHH